MLKVQHFLWRFRMVIALGVAFGLILGFLAAATTKGASCLATGRYNLTVNVGGIAGPNCSQAIVSDTFGRVVHRKYLHSGLQISGTLLAPNGNPAPGVSVTVQATPITGGNPVVVAQGTTNAAGTYQLVTPEGASRNLVITAADAEAMVQELVAPSMWFGVISKHNAHLIFYGGLITGGATDPPTVTVQDSTPNGWRTFAAVSPKPNGRFSVPYHSDPNTMGYRFQFRIATLPATNWEPGVSYVRSAMVRG
jgi:hypothetical protein